MSEDANMGCARACSLVFADVLHELISWPRCSSCVAKYYCLSSALLYCCKLGNAKGGSRISRMRFFEALSI